MTARPAPLAGVILCFANSNAAAHGLGQRYDLPIPLWLYLVGAASAVAASFVLFAAFRSDLPRLSWRADFVSGTVPRWLALALQGFGIAVFALVVAAGLFGNQNPLKNIAPLTIWVLWWVGFSFFCAFVGDAWPLLSPFATMSRVAAAARRRAGSPRLRRRLRLPRSIGVWPAVALFWLFAWSELIAPGRDRPRAVALGVLGYAVFTWLGCIVFGTRAWTRAAEAFAIACGLLGRFAPLQVIRSGEGWRWRLRPYAVGLLSIKRIPVSLTFFALLMLATLTVDGLLETPLWLELANTMARARLPSPSTLLLLAGPLVFAAAYAAVIGAMARLAGGRVTDLAGRFVLSLVPIAISYHLAHYLSFLLLAGQMVVPIASDPFGYGWDLFGTTLYRLNIGIVDARFVWLTSVAAIVVGHIAATWVAHRVALRTYSDQRSALKSQYPMIVLMIGYTVTSLWILAQPIVQGP
jgi:hypothetical protein